MRAATFARTSAREPVASLAYTRHVQVPRELHAVTRLRQLFAGALGYPVPDAALSARYRKWRALMKEATGV